MTEFEQIIGRGTRIHEESRKYYFKLIDFRKASTHFADPNWDGEPVRKYEPGQDDPCCSKLWALRTRASELKPMRP